MVGGLVEVGGVASGDLLGSGIAAFEPDGWMGLKNVTGHSLFIGNLTWELDLGTIFGCTVLCLKTCGICIFHWRWLTDTL